MTDVSDAKIAMEVDSLIYQPILPTFDEAEEIEFETVEGAILKRALKSSKLELTNRIYNRNLRVDRKIESFKT